MSGLFLRHMPLALMKLADRVPINVSRSKRVDSRRVVPILSFDHIAITSVITLAIYGAGPINRTRYERFEPPGFPLPPQAMAR